MTKQENLNALITIKESAIEAYQKAVDNGAIPADSPLALTIENVTNLSDLGLLNDQDASDMASLRLLIARTQRDRRESFIVLTLEDLAQAREDDFIDGFGYHNFVLLLYVGIICSHLDMSDIMQEVNAEYEEHLTVKGVDSIDED